MKIRYITKTQLVTCYQQASIWNYNRQVTENVKSLPDFNYPVLFSMEHNHRNGVLCEPHIRCMVGGSKRLDDKSDIFQFVVDIPIEFFNSLTEIEIPDPPEKL